MKKDVAVVREGKSDIRNNASKDGLTHITNTVKNTNHNIFIMNTPDNKVTIPDFLGQSLKQDLCPGLIWSLMCSINEYDLKNKTGVAQLVQRWA
jgi:hypothetical protein